MFLLHIYEKYPVFLQKSGWFLKVESCKEQLALPLLNSGRCAHRPPCNRHIAVRANKRDRKNGRPQVSVKENCQPVKVSSFYHPKILLAGNYQFRGSFRILPSVMGLSASVKAFALYWMQSIVKFSLPVFFNARLPSGATRTIVFDADYLSMLTSWYWREPRPIFSACSRIRIPCRELIRSMSAAASSPS